MMKGLERMYEVEQMNTVEIHRAVIWGNKLYAVLQFMVWTEPSLINGKKLYDHRKYLETRENIKI